MNRLPLRSFRGITPVSEPARILGLRGKKKVFLCRVLGYDLYKVDGVHVRSQHADFIGGGHRIVYRFVPAREIWIDGSVKEWLGHLASHELFEVLLMQLRGWKYDRAHAAANMLEQELRGVSEAQRLNQETIRIAWFYHLTDRFPAGVGVEDIAAVVARQLWKYV